MFLLLLSILLFILFFKNKRYEKYIGQEPSIKATTTLQYFHDKNPNKKAICITKDLTYIFIVLQNVKDEATWYTANFETLSTISLINANIVSDSYPDVASMFTYCLKKVNAPTNNINVKLELISHKQLDEFLSKKPYLVDYRHLIPTDRLLYFIPFVRYVSINRMMNRATQCIVLDTVLYSYDKVNPVMNKNIDESIVNKDANRFFHIFFTFYPDLEQFSLVQNTQQNIGVTIDFPISLVILENSFDIFKKFELKGILHTFNFVPGDVVTLTNQAHSVQNGRYIINNIDKDKDTMTLQTHISLEFIKHFKIIMSRNAFSSDYIWYDGSNKVILGTQTSQEPLKNGLIWFTDMKRLGNVIDGRVVIYISEKQDSEEDDYFCTTDKVKATQYACEESNGVWDAPCKVDTDCPFYQKDKYRGGCNNGYCEMPLGVEEIKGGFRRYNGSTKPWCKNCADCECENPGPFVFPFELKLEENFIISPCLSDSKGLCEADDEFNERSMKVIQPKNLNLEEFSKPDKQDPTIEAAMYLTAENFLLTSGNIMYKLDKVLLLGYKKDDKIDNNLFISMRIVLGSERYAWVKIIELVANKRVENNQDNIKFYNYRFIGSESRDVSTFSSPKTYQAMIS